MTTQNITQSLLNTMQFRCIGPPRGGRVIAVAGDPSDVATFYFGACAGGIWKTTDAGITWKNVSDGYVKTAAVGALAVSESDPNVIYAGMGEATIRGNVSYGDGVYKSTDSGNTWTHLGLADTRHIGKVVIHPRNPDIVYVAALGHAFGPNAERGVYRTRDGGKTWDHVLFKSETAGAVDITLDAHNPDVLYASIWQAIRTPWSLSSGGPESGLWKSIDGGDTWTDISDKLHENTGIAQGIKGKIGVAASPAQGGRVWAIVETKDGALLRSDDFGETWLRMSEEQNLRYRPWYYHHIIPDPQEADTVYVMNLGMWKSRDGGATFSEIPTPHGDNHGLWIDPNNNRRMIQSNDGGANVSFNGGETFSTVFNQLTAQYYRMAVDNQYPYRVYGTQQDNASVSVPSNSHDGIISWGDCYNAGTGESGYIAVHPEDPNIVFVGAVGSSPGGGGALQRYDHRTKQIQLVNVWPQDHSGYGPDTLKYRFPWTFPIVFSPHDANTLYTAGNVAFRSTNEGMSWEPISPDLSRAAPETLVASGGPITLDTSGAEHYGSVASFIESPHEAGVLWAGSDDGLLHLSRDNGENWALVTPPELPEWTTISTIEPSPTDPATVYLAATRYKLDDTRPYLFKTNDYGQTWADITGEGDTGIPADDYTRVIRADPNCAGLLYVGTETGLYLSFDDGVTWRRWQSNLPVVPIYDMVVKDTDLVLATHGRSFWILDDLTPLHQLATQSDEPIALFAPRTSIRGIPDLMSAWLGDNGKVYSSGYGQPAISDNKRNQLGELESDVLDAGKGMRPCAMVYYSLAEAISKESPVGSSISLSFLDADGAVIRTFTTKPDGYDKLDDKEKSMQPGPWLSGDAGVHRFLWDMRHEGARRVPGNKLAGEANTGPLVLPGTYQVRLTVGDTTQVSSFEIINDPRVTTPISELEEQLAMLLQIRDKISSTHDGINKLRDVVTQVTSWKTHLSKHEHVVKASDEVLDKLNTIEDKLIKPGEHNDTFGLNEPSRLTTQLASVMSVVGLADRAPTQQSREVAAYYTELIDEQLANLQEVLDSDLESFNSLIEAVNAPAVVI
ncbi:MAG: glycosyl hydrolase [Chloroflexota bacterium]